MSCWTRDGREDEAILYLPVRGVRAILDATGRVDWVKSGRDGVQKRYGGDRAGNQSKGGQSCPGQA